MFAITKVITPLLALLIAITSGVGVDIGLYEMALEDVMLAEAEEIYPLVTITEDSDMVTWNEYGEVLMLTFHRYPDSYVAGEEVTLEWGEVWTFTDRELSAWYKENKDGVEDWDLRFEQLLGLPEEKEYTHFTAMWVSPEDIIRPAYNTDATVDEMYLELPDDVDENYLEWFESNFISSYETSKFPWTRLGYTYDWIAVDDFDYGLTEFLVLPDSVVTIEFTLTVEEFLEWLEMN